MRKTAAANYDVPSFDGRGFYFGDCRRVIRLVGGNVIMGLGAVAAVAVLVATVTLAAAWIVNTALAARPHIHATEAGTLALVDPTLAGDAAVSFADKWARATGSMQASGVPVLRLHPLEIADTPRITQVATLTPAPASPPNSVLPLPPKRPPNLADSVPLPQPHPAPHPVALGAPDPIGRQIVPQVATAAPAEKLVAPQEAHNKPTPTPDSRTAVYDISARTVYMPNGERLEAHSGLGDKLDDPRYVKVRMRGPTPPNVYDLTLREELFHGVKAIRLNPVDDGKMFGRAGMLAHTYMLGPNGQSNGCVSFRDYDKFLHSFLRGEVARLVVVPNLDTTPSRVAVGREPEYRYAANY